MRPHNDVLPGMRTACLWLGGGTAIRRLVSRGFVARDGDMAGIAGQ